MLPQGRLMVYESGQWRYVGYGPSGPTGATGATGPAGPAVRAVQSIASTATPAINTNVCSMFCITALANPITNFVMSGVNGLGNTLLIQITDTGSNQSITWGSSFEPSGNVALPTTTISLQTLTVGFIWNAVTSKWRCIAYA